MLVYQSRTDGYLLCLARLELVQKLGILLERRLRLSQGVSVIP